MFEYEKIFLSNLNTFCFLLIYYALKHNFYHNLSILEISNLHFLYDCKVLINYKMNINIYKVLMII